MRKSIHFLRVWITSIVVLLSTEAFTSSSEEVDILLTNATVFSPPETVINNASIAIKGNRIYSVGRNAKHRAREVIDLRGRTVIPGLINTHEHLFIGPDSDDSYWQLIEDTAEEKFFDYLRHGITTVMSVGDYFPQIVKVRDDVVAGKWLAPRLLISGPMMCPSRGHPTDIQECKNNPYCQQHWAAQVDSVAAAREKVREIAAAKVDAIKIAYDGRGVGNDGVWKMGQFKPEVVRAIINEAHKQNLPVAVYPAPVENAINAIHWGADRLAHGPLTVHMTNEPGGVLKWPHKQLDEFAELARQKRIPVSTTISTTSVYTDFWGSERLLHTGGKVADMPEMSRKMLLELGEQAKLDVRIFNERGVILAYGDDTYRVMPGVSLKHEVQALSESGLTPAQILTAATRNAALFVGMEDQLGTVEPGKLADLVVLAKSPLKDINALERVDLVIKDGQVVFDYFAE